MQDFQPIGSGDATGTRVRRSASTQLGVRARDDSNSQLDEPLPKTLRVGDFDINQMAQMMFTM